MRCCVVWALSLGALGWMAVARGADLQARIDAAAKSGEPVVVQAGVHETPPLTLRSNVRMVLERGAVLQASTNLADYAVMPAGEKCFLYAEDATNVTIVGDGVIDGRGFAFVERTGLAGESQPQDLPVLMRFTRCRNLTLEGFTYRRSGAWGCHLHNCDGVTMRRVSCFNHVNNTNDGIDIESCNVLIEDCDIDSDDDAVVFKTESDKAFAVTNVVVRNCRLASCCNALKFGTGSYAEFRDITIENCDFVRAKDNCRFSWFKTIPGVTNRICGIAGLALEVVDGGRMSGVRVRGIRMEGYQTPIFVRLGQRHAPVAGCESYLRDIIIEDVEAVADSRIACSITGVPGLRPRGILLHDVRLRFPGGGTAADAVRAVPEKESSYPESFMFSRAYPDTTTDAEATLPAWGFYLRHADDVVFENVTLELLGSDARAEVVTDDVTGFARRSSLDVIPAPRTVRFLGGDVRVRAADVTYGVDASLPAEGYRLRAASDGVKVIAADAAGRFYAQQTLRQMAARADGMCPAVEIEDAPRFAWRGVLIDESRHFYGKEVVKRVLDRMSAFKLNVLHWHLVDSHGWRIQIDRYPELTQRGATRPVPDWDFNMRDAEGLVGDYGPFFYTKDEIREVIAYAAERHIRVVPEIEIPGHSREVILCHPDFSCLDWGRFADMIRTVDKVDQAAALCVGNDDVIRFLENVLDEVCELFPDEIVHIGGDECPRGNWADCPKCQSRMKAECLLDEGALQNWITRRFAAYLAKKGRRIIGWDEILEGGLPDGAIVQSWRGAEGGIAAANVGHDAVVCPHLFCYLDYPTGLKDDPCAYPRFGEKTFLPLEKVYSFDPLAGIPTGQWRHILGAESLNWGESTWCERDLEYKMWPRTCASAEVCWTGPGSRTFDDFLRRLRPIARRMKDNGVNLVVP